MGERFIIPCNEEGKAHVAHIIIRAVDDIDMAAQRLSALMGRLNLMDVRHDDFVLDAGLRERILNLREMSRELHEATFPSGPLGEHFDREPTTSMKGEG